MVSDFRLKVFYIVAQKLSFTKAASALFISQPAVTKHIHELEQQLGSALFRRNGNTITLTGTGEVLLRYAEKIFEMYAELEREIAIVNDVTTGHVRIGASTTIAQHILPKILAVFKKTYPEVAYTFVQGNTDFISTQVIAEKLDIAIVEGSSHFPQLAYDPFAKDEIVWVTKVNGILSKFNEISPDQLTGIPLILREEGSGTLDVVFKALSKFHVNPKNLQVEARFQNSSSIKQYLLHSETAAFLSIQTVLNELKHNQLKIIEIKGLEIFRTFQFIHLHGNTSKITELFKRFCKTHN